MNRLFYGSSNVYRHFPRSSIGTELNISLVQCTKKAVFDSHLASLCPLGSGALIVSSVLENFIADVCHGLEVSEAGLFANQQITAHVEALAAAVRDTPDSHAFISPLLDRRIPSKPVICVLRAIRKEKQNYYTDLWLRKKQFILVYIF